MNLLLLSNSTLVGEPYLQWPKQLIRSHLGAISEAVFIPYAAVSFSYDRYEEMVGAALAEIGVTVQSVHRVPDPRKAIREAKAVLIGGGNTFHLLNALYRESLVEELRERVSGGMPYVGWSAGSNVACPTIKTTNDMPIVEPPSFNALGLCPFQINPHYTEKTIDGHGGETRLQRLQEYAVVNDVPVLCLPEGCAAQCVDGAWTLHSNEPLKWLDQGGQVRLVPPGHFDV